MNAIDQNDPEQRARDIEFINHLAYAGCSRILTDSVIKTTGSEHPDQLYCYSHR